MQPEQSPYDFIMNSGQTPQKTVLPSGGSNSMLRRALLFGGFLFVLFILGIILMSVLSSDGGTRVSLLKVAQVQAESVRVADTIRKDTSSQPIKNLSINTSFGVASDQTELLSASGLSGISFDEKELALGASSKTDGLLETAKTAGTYNQVALQVLAAQLSQYQSALKDSYQKTKSPEIKAALLASAEHAALLQKQLESTQP